METNQTNGITMALSIRTDLPRNKKGVETQNAADTEGLKRNIQKQHLEREEVKKRIEELITKFSLNRELKIHYDEDVNKLIITVVDSDSQRVIRQIPDEETMSFIRHFQQYVGALINRRV
jgi:uncharacterized FlaG/YvyC family protein